MKCECNSNKRQENKKTAGRATNVFTGSLLLLMPKCAMCWAAYLSFFGITGSSMLGYRSWFLPLAAVLFVFTLVRMLWRSLSAGNYPAFVLALSAAGFIAWQRWKGPDTGITVFAMTLVTFAWLAETRLKTWFPLSRFRSRAQGVTGTKVGA